MDKWRKYVHGVAYPQLKDGYKTEEFRQCLKETSVGGFFIKIVRTSARVHWQSRDILTGDAVA